MDIEMIMDKYGLDIGEYFTIEHHQDLGRFSFINSFVPQKVVLVDSSRNYCSQATYMALGMLVSGDFKVIKVPHV